MARATVTFQVRIETYDRKPGSSTKRVPKWLTQAATLTENQDEAVTFTFYRSPTPKDRHAIEVGTHELTGLAQWVDLERGIESTTKTFTAELEARLWPGGRPEATGADYLAQQDELAKAWDEDDSTLRAGLSEMLRLRDRARFLAAWPVLGVNLPEGWGSIADRDDLDEELLQALWNAHTAAVGMALLEQAGSSAP